MGREHRLTEHLKEDRLDRLARDRRARRGGGCGDRLLAAARRHGIGLAGGGADMIVCRTALLPRLKVYFRAPPSAP